MVNGLHLNVGYMCIAAMKNQSHALQFQMWF